MDRHLLTLRGLLHRAPFTFQEECRSLFLLDALLLGPSNVTSSENLDLGLTSVCSFSVITDPSLPVPVGDDLKDLPIENMALHRLLEHQLRA